MEKKPDDQMPESNTTRQIPRDKDRLSRLRSMAQPALPETSPETALHDAQSRTAFVPGVVHVVLKEGVDGRRIARQWGDPDAAAEFGPNLAVLRNLVNQHGFVRVEPTFDFTPPGMKPEENPPAGRERYLTFYFTTEQNTQLISNKLRDTALIERAVPAPKIIPSRSPLDEPFLNTTIMSQSPQWYIQRCNAHLGWQLKGPNQFFSGSGVVVADIDWGFRVGHQEFDGNRIESTYNSMTGGAFVGDNMGHTVSHGTAVLALLGAGANGLGMSGFAFGADLWAIQADNGMDHGLIAPFRFWWFAIDYVRRTDSNGRRKVICLEAETADYCNIESDPSINQVIQDAIAAGVVVCVPAGNGNRDAARDVANVEFPPTGSILVGATIFDANPAINRKAGFSNWSPRVVVSAPGDPDNDMSAFSRANDAYENFGGTSGATPKVAGAVALMLEANPQLTHAEIRDILNTTGTPITDAATTPVGTFLNVQAAVGEAQRRAAPSDHPQPYPADIAQPENGTEKLAHCAAESRKIARSKK